MPMKDGFDPADSLPRFLVHRVEQEFDDAFDEPAPRSGVVKASLMIVSATAIGIVVLAVGDPLIAWVSDSLAGNPSRAIATLQSAADQVVPPAATHAPARNETAAVDETAVHQTENSELPSKTLQQFQAWAAEQEAQAPGKPAPPAPNSPAPVAQNAPPQEAPASASADARVPAGVAHKRRQGRSIRDARAELRTQNLRRQARRAERARAERPPEQDSRAQQTSPQDAPALPYWFGLGR